MICVEFNIHLYFVRCQFYMQIPGLFPVRRIEEIRCFVFEACAWRVPEVAGREL